MTSRKTSQIFLLAISFAGISYAAEAATKAKPTRKERIANSKLVTDHETGVTPAWNLSGGIILGSPTGLVMKNEFAPDQAVDFGLSYSFSKMLNIYGDWQYRFPGVFEKAGAHGEFAKIEAYLGVGAALLISSGGTDNPIKKENKSSSMGLLIRIPLGLQYKMSNKPFAFFLELTPGMGVIPGTFGYFGGGIGARYYFR